MLTNDHLLSSLRNNLEELYSPKVQLEIEQQTNDVNKRAFVNEREKLSNYLHTLETQKLESVLAKMRPFESELNQAISDLNRELKSINNTVKVLGTIRNISSVLAKVVTFF